MSEDYMKAVALPLVGKYEPVLRQRAEEIEPGTDCRLLAAQMLATMHGGKGIGLAAPQVGRSVRLIVGMHKDFSFCILNPVITRRGKDKQWFREGCLSLPGTLVGKRRCKVIEVQGHDINWQPLHLKARNLMAQVLQHEIDHLDGVLMTDEAQDALMTQKETPFKEPPAPSIITRSKTKVTVLGNGIGLVHKQGKKQ